VGAGQQSCVPFQPIGWTGKETRMITKPRATIEDLTRVDGKAELVNGEIVEMPPTGDEPSSAAGNVFVSLLIYGRTTSLGRAYTDNVGFLVDLPGRKSFSPDVAFFVGARTGLKFLEGAPLFAVEVRSENDYGPQAELEMARKRADYFAAGTRIVWDVDLRSETPVRKYTSESQHVAAEFRRGETADAEPALPEWRFPIDELFI
jgi:Uma2 family endonuclease